MTFLCCVVLFHYCAGVCCGGNRDGKASSVSSCHSIVLVHSFSSSKFPAYFLCILGRRHTTTSYTRYANSKKYAKLSSSNNNNNKHHYLFLAGEAVRVGHGREQHEAQDRQVLQRALEGHGGRGEAPVPHPRADRLQGRLARSQNVHSNAQKIWVASILFLCFCCEMFGKKRTEVV